jgi:hypothetical protein
MHSPGYAVWEVGTVVDSDIYGDLYFLSSFPSKTQHLSKLLCLIQQVSCHDCLFEAKSSIFYNSFHNLRNPHRILSVMGPSHAWRHLNRSYSSGTRRLLRPSAEPLSCVALLLWLCNVGSVSVVNLGGHKQLWLLAGVAKPPKDFPHMLCCFLCIHALIKNLRCLWLTPFCARICPIPLCKNLCGLEALFRGSH